MKKLNDKRGVLYVSEKCNARCRFCVLRNELNKKPQVLTKNLKRALLKFKKHYRFDYIDLAGQEPTLNKDLKEIVKYCNEIGLEPTIVTNGQLTSVIEDILPELDDLVLSVHNIGEHYDHATQISGWKNLQNTLNMLKRNNFRFRINCAVNSLNLTRLKDIVDIAGEYNVRILDFLGWCGEDFDNETVASYTECAKAIKEAIDYSKKYPNLIINVRWIPFCFMKGYEKYVLNWHQWIYNKYSWNEAAGNSINLITPEEYEGWIIQKTSLNYKKGECLKCMNKNICDGIGYGYLGKFGKKEFQPVEGELIEDFMFYRGEK